MSWWDATQNALGFGSGDPTNQDRTGLRANGAAGAAMGAQGQAGYTADTGQLGAQQKYLQQLASGQNSVSAQQLQQALGQNQAQQMSMAAGAAPQNAAMAARNAAMNSARLGTGLAGQQAVAGLQERNQANEQLAQLNLGMRGQDASMAQGGLGIANQAYGTAIANPQKTGAGLIGGALGGLASYAPMAFGMGRGAPQSSPGGPGLGSMSNPVPTSSYGGTPSDGYFYSDRRLKTDVKDAKGKASSMLDGLKAYAYRYEDDTHGKGEQVGVMAQDLERNGLGSVVEDTARGKRVHGGKLAAANTAMLVALADRVKKIEGK